MANIDQALLSAGAPDTGVNIDKALEFAGDDSPQPKPVGPPPTAGTSFEQGFGDTIHGAARLLTHVLPQSVVDAGNKLNNWLATKTPLVATVPAGGVDEMVAKREQQYQDARTAVGQTGIDWWRLAGNAVQPANYLGPSGAATVGGRIAQSAVQGAGLGAVQSSSESQAPGNYWWDVAKGTTLGAATGGLISSAIEGVMPALRWGISKARGLIGAGADPSAVYGSADAIVNQALKDTGKDPASFDLNMLKGMRQDVQSAIEHGADISPASIINRTRAESLPVPIRLTRGQATGDAMQFAKEQNLRGIAGVGEPMTQRLTEQNAGFIANLDALGAKNASDPVSTGMTYSAKIQNTWDALQARKNDLYSAVRNAQGQSAAVDGIHAADRIKAALDTPQASHAYDLLPANIKKTIESLRSGEFPLTIAQSQSLDKIWGDAARGADGSMAYAINQARRILGEAPVQDELGDQARQAYALARQAHASQMSLLDPKLPNGMPNPNFQPLVKAVVQDGKPPEQLFSTHFLNAAPSVAQKNLAFLSQIDPNAPQQIGQTLMGEIKRQALTSASDERGTVSEAVLRGWARDPVKSARLDALLPKPAVDTFHNLAATVEAAKKIPVASAVNTSNTGSALVNAGTSMLKNSAVAQIAKRLPIARDIAEGLTQAGRQTDVQAALKPGVTIKSLLSSTPSQGARAATLSRVLTPAAVTIEQSDQGP